MKVLHLLTTSLCNRDCPFCCNKQYDLNSIPYVSDEDIKQCDTICITGGEPILYTNVVNLSVVFKSKYSNIKRVYVYANAYELWTYLMHPNKIKIGAIDGFSISIKDKYDLFAFKDMLKMPNQYLQCLKSNRIYLFDRFEKEKWMPTTSNFEYVKREWQEDFKPADNCIFRKL